MQIGSALGPYRILRLLGSGGMGAVWLADDTRLNRHVALKTLRPSDSHDVQARERLTREARAAAALNHSHIAAVYDVLEHDEQVVIVFEYVEGETLSARLARGPLPVPEAVEVACQIALALVTAHAHGVVHRDLKPANVIVGADGEVKVLDFGIARLLSIGTTVTSGDGQTASGPGFMGTPGYAAPEQMVSSAVDERADLYALGVMLFEMISGRRPFPGNDAVALATSKLGRDAPPLSPTGRLVPPAVSRLVGALLARDPDDRPSSASDVLAQLRAVHTQPGNGGSVPDARNPVLGPVLIGAAVLVVGLLGLGAWGWQFPAPPPPTSAPPVVAVLPLANMSGDPSRDFIAAGIAESLISSLAALPTITVLSRAAVAEALVRSPQTASLAKDLGATYLVEGSVQESGGQLRVTLNLVRPDRTVAWGDTVEGAFEKIFDLQSRLAGALTTALAVRVSAKERDLMNAQPTSSPEALTAYWQGRALMDRRDVKGNLEAALAAYSQAIALDSRFALAHAALGEAYWRQYISTNDPSSAQKATAEGLTALRLDPDEPAVRYTLAMTLAGTGKLAEAAEELQRALALKPNYDDARREFGSVLARQGRLDEAIAEYRKAIAQRPNFWGHHSALGFSLFRAARYAEAETAFRRAMELQPDNAMVYQQLGTVYQAMGRDTDAIANYERAIAIQPIAAAYSNMGALFHTRGEYAKAVQAYLAAIELRPNSHVTRRNLGDAYRRMGREEDAMSAYREAVRLVEAQLKVNPRDPESLGAVAVYLAKLHDDSAAQSRVREALAVAPNDIQVQFYAGVVHALGGRADAAITALRHAIDGGYSRASVRDEEDLESLSRLPAFQALVTPQPSPSAGAKP